MLCIAIRADSIFIPVSKKTNIKIDIRIVGQDMTTARIILTILVMITDPFMESNLKA